MGSSGLTTNKASIRKYLLKALHGAAVPPMKNVCLPDETRISDICLATETCFSIRIAQSYWGCRIAVATIIAIHSFPELHRVYEAITVRLTCLVYIRQLQHEAFRQQCEIYTPHTLLIVFASSGCKAWRVAKLFWKHCLDLEWREERAWYTYEHASPLPHAHCRRVA